jgi:hypothetical protein
MRTVEKNLIGGLLLLLLLGCSGPAKFYRGELKPPSEVSTIITPNDAQISVDTRDFAGDVEVLPGKHRLIVVSYCPFHVTGQLFSEKLKTENTENNCLQKPVVGFVGIHAKPGRRYTAFVGIGDGRIHTWAVDLEKCQVVAGDTPVDPHEMSDKQLRCVEPERSVNVANIVMLPVGLAALSLYAIEPQMFVSQESAESSLCEVEPCNFGLPLNDRASARLIIPGTRALAWDFGEFLNIYGVSIPDGLPAWRESDNMIRLAPGDRELVIEGIAQNSIWGYQNRFFDGLVLSAEPARIYALCMAPNSDGETFASWIVDYETGKVVSGARSRETVATDASRSTYCATNYSN